MVVNKKNSQADHPLMECEFVFTTRSVKVAYNGTCYEALEQLFKCGKCTQDEIANIMEIKERDLRAA